MSDSLIPSFLVSDVNESFRSLTKNERCEQIAQVAHQKWVTMSDLLSLLTKNDWPWANRSGRSLKMSESLIFSQKTSDSLRKPMGKFPALQYRHISRITFLFLTRTFVAVCAYCEIADDTDIFSSFDYFFIFLFKVFLFLFFVCIFLSFSDFCIFFLSTFFFNFVLCIFQES